MVWQVWITNIHGNQAKHAHEARKLAKTALVKHKIKSTWQIY